MSGMSFIRVGYGQASARIYIVHESGETIDVNYMNAKRLKSNAAVS